MCGRYDIEAEDLGAYGIVLGGEQGMAEAKTGEISPTDIAPVISPKGMPTAMRWGFSKPDGKGALINARSESAAERATFRRLLSEGRCLIPASWYFEWEKFGGIKVKYAFSPSSGETAWLAGLSRYDAKAGRESFVILTRPAWSGISSIHDRMPVILPKESRDEWLNGSDPNGTMSRAISEMQYRAV